MAQNKNINVIKNNLNVTRHDIDETIDKIGKKLSVNNLIGETLSVDKINFNNLNKYGETMIDLIKRYPISTTLIGSGLALAFSAASKGGETRVIDQMSRNNRSRSARLRQDNAQRGVDGSHDGSGFDFDGIKQGIKNAPHAVAVKSSELAESGKEFLADSYRSVTEKTSQFGHSVSEQASHLSHEVADRSSHLGHEFKVKAHDGVNFVSHNPVAMAAGAGMLGLLIGILVPETETENQYVGEYADQVRDEARVAKERVTEEAKNLKNQVL